MVKPEYPPIKPPTKGVVEEAEIAFGGKTSKYFFRLEFLRYAYVNKYFERDGLGN